MGDLSIPHNFYKPTRHVTIKGAGEGLTLTAANHVLLAEPVADEALRRQACARVNRIGQGRKSEVVTFVVEDSLEEEVERVREVRAEERERGGGDGTLFLAFFC